MYVTDEKDPDLLFVIENESDRKEIDKIQKIVDGMNHDLEDSGFGQYSYDVVVRGKKVYVKRNLKTL